MPRFKEFTKKNAARLLPERKTTSNKASAGRALIIAGSEGMFGAAVLSSTAAARVGAGYVTLLTNAKGFPSQRNPDFLIRDYKKEKVKNIKFQAVAIGPGLGMNPLTKKLLSEVLQSKAQRVVIDADALNVSAKYKIRKFPALWILTPHEAELGRLLNVSASSVKNNRRKFILLAQKKFGCIVLLKGHHTLVADAHTVIEVKSGNASLAKAGTGDVLTGIICGLLAQGIAPLDAAALGVFIHGYLADEWVKKNDILTLMASDLLALIPEALKKLRKN